MNLDNDMLVPTFLEKNDRQNSFFWKTHTRLAVKGFTEIFQILRVGVSCYHEVEAIFALISSYLGPAYAGPN